MWLCFRGMLGYTLRGTLLANPLRRTIHASSEYPEGPQTSLLQNDMSVGQNPNRTNRLKWVVHLPQNGTIGFELWQYVHPRKSKETNAILRMQTGTAVGNTHASRWPKWQAVGHAKSAESCVARSVSPFGACGVFAQLKRVGSNGG